MPACTRAARSCISTAASERSERGWTLGANSRLPPSVAVLWAQPVADDFHARYSARARRYRYRIVNRPVRAALDARRAAWERVPLDVEAMHAAAPALHRRTRFQRVPHGRVPGQVGLAQRARDRDHARGRRRRSSRSKRTHSCITWCATSSVRCCRSVAAKQTPEWLAEAARRPRPRERGPDRAGRRPDVPRPALSCAWNLPAEVTL